MAIHTPITLTEVAPNLLRHYGLTLQRLTPILSGTTNTTYKLTAHAANTTADLCFILTLFENMAEAAQARAWLPPFLVFLAKHGLPVAPPLKTLEGTHHILIKQKTCVLSPCLTGSEGGQKNLTPSTASKAAVLLAQFRHISQQYSKTTPLPPPHPWHWGNIPSLLKTLQPHPQEAQNTLYLQAITQELTAPLPQTEPLPQGIIHADFFADNLLLNRGKITGLIDFYKAGTDAFACDLAMALAAWSFTSKNTLQEDVLHALLTAYQTITPLNTAEKQALPQLCLRACCVIMLMRLLTLQKERADGIKPRPPKAFYDRYLAFKTIKNWTTFYNE